MDFILESMAVQDDWSVVFCVHAALCMHVHLLCTLVVAALHFTCLPCYFESLFLVLGLCFLPCKGWGVSC